MANALLPTALWDLIEPLLPIPDDKPEGGRPTSIGSGLSDGHSVRTAKRDSLADAAKRAGLRLRHERGESVPLALDSIPFQQ